MSEEEFEVEGAHEHAVEHASHGGGMAQRIAIFTALLSTLGAMVSYQGGATQNQAMLYKNEAVLKKALATDQWGFYQAKSSKGHLMELAADIVPKDKVEHYREQIAKYDKEKQEIKKKAEALDAESQAADEMSEKFMHPHHKLAQAMTLIQIAISLASITVLTKKRWLFVGAVIAATGGISIALIAFFA